MIFLLVTLLAVKAAQPAPPPHPRNVILLIADGAGPGHFTVARSVRGKDFRIGTMPVVGLFTTECADRAVTDSAAGATALATGVKTNYETLSLDPQTGAPLPTVLEVAEKLGKATGTVTTADFWDATPGAFMAHSKNRRDRGVEEQVLSSGADIIAGTGIEDFGKDPLPPLQTLADKHGYTLITSGPAVSEAKGEKLLAVFPRQDRNVDVPEATLPFLAAWAIDHLALDPDGFFLLIEHEGTDSSSHQNHSADLRKSLASFDQAVGVALDFAAKDGHTLVVVCADHETGGLRISETRQLARWRIEWSSTDHTATAVPVFAYGPGSAVFAGFHDNTDIGKDLLAAVGGK